MNTDTERHATSGRVLTWGSMESKQDSLSSVCGFFPTKAVRWGDKHTDQHILAETGLRRSPRSPSEELPKRTFTFVGLCLRPVLGQNLSPGSPDKQTWPPVSGRSIKHDNEKGIYPEVLHHEKEPIKRFSDLPNPSL